MKELENKAIEAVRDTRALTRDSLGTRTKWVPPPELLARLAEMQKERDAIIETEVAAMKTALGPVKAAQMDAIIEQKLAPQTEARPMTPSEREDLMKLATRSEGGR
jgi:hypothetical protein